MAVVLEFVNVIVRKSAVERQFLGGLDAFARQDLANLAEDDHILRVGFMSTRDALTFVGKLEALGLRYLEADSDIAVITGHDDTGLPPWLAVGSIDGCAACWDSHHAAGEVMWPEPGFLLRCPRPVYERLAEVLRPCGAQIDQASNTHDELKRPIAILPEAQPIQELLA